MERRSKILVSAAVVALGIGVACSFPEVTYSDGVDAGAEIDSGEVDTGAPPVIEEDAGFDAGPEGDADADSGPPELVEAGFPSDGGIVEDASLCNGPDAGLRRCDCDDDGWSIKDCDGGVPAGLHGSKKDGWDCDDLNKDVNPAASYKTVPMADGGWDWNCNGVTDQAYEGYRCDTILCKTGAVGYKEDVPCGQAATVFQCTGLVGGVVCAPSELSQNEVRGCK